MTDYDDVMREINELKHEVERLREVVSALFQMVVENEEPEFDDFKKPDRDLSFNN